METGSCCNIDGGKRQCGRRNKRRHRAAGRWLSGWWGDAWPWGLSAASTSLNPGEFIQADQCYLISARPATPSPSATSTTEAELWFTPTLTDTDGVSYCQKEKKMKKKTTTSRSLEDEWCSKSAGDRRAGKQFGALSQLRFILWLVAGRHGGEGN